MSTPASPFQVEGDNKAALFTLKLHRGEGMCLLAMNWKNGKPRTDFVGFAIEYKEPKSDQFFVLNNRLAFANPKGAVNPATLSTRLSLFKNSDGSIFLAMQISLVTLPIR